MAIRKCTFGRSTLLAGAGVAALSAALSVPVYAQEDEDQIVVTGIRRSIEDSLRVKRESTSIVEAISAEDIGKLPDVSIADSLARLPGVTAQRVRGRAQQISIRGLGPDFSIALLNGREQVSAGNNRGIEFDQFPSELINSGIVYKTPDARLAATGVAGAVDLRTIRPLSHDGVQVNVSGRYVTNDNGELNPDFDSDGYRLFGSIIGQNADRTIGWSLAVTDQSNPTHFYSRELKTNSGQVEKTATGTYYPRDNPRTGVVSRNFKRTSVAGALQFDPTDRFDLIVDGYYSQFEDEGIFRGVETPLASWGGVGTPTVQGGGHFAGSATYENVGAILRTDTEGNSADLFSLGVNTSYQVSDRLKATLDISTSSLEKDDIDYESYAGTGSGILGSGDASLLDTMKYRFDLDGEYSIATDRDYTDSETVMLADPGGWGGQVGFIKEPQIEDDLSQIRAEAEYEVDNNLVTSIVAGVLITDREKTFNSNENFIRPGNGFTGTNAPIPTESIIGATDSGSINFDIIAYDPSSLIDDGTYTLEAANSVAWQVEEKINTFYAMANIDTDVGVPLIGNAGVRYVNVEQSSTGTLEGEGEQTLGDEYTHLLPSLNLSLEVAEDTLIRFAAAKTVTRPRLDQMTANQSLSVNSTVCTDTSGDGVVDTVDGLDPQAGRSCFNFSGGNPELQPYESTSFDLAFEKYFDSATAISIAFFHKTIANWVVDKTVLVDVTEQMTQAGYGDVLTSFPQVAIVATTRPENFEEAKITGFEATVRSDLARFLPEEFQGFGVEASYTNANASLENSDGDVIAIPGYSEVVWSTSLYYENNGLRGKLNARNRSDFLSEVQLFDGGLVGAEALSETVLDVQVGYEFQDGPLEGLAVNFEAYNVTDEPFRTENNFHGTSTFVSRHEHYGTTYNFTVSRKF